MSKSIDLQTPFVATTQPNSTNNPVNPTNPTGPTNPTSTPAQATASPAPSATFAPQSAPAPEMTLQFSAMPTHMPHTSSHSPTSHRADGLGGGPHTVQHASNASLPSIYRSSYESAPIEEDAEELLRKGGKRLDRESLVARGGFGAIYRAYDRRLRRQVAVKVLESRAIFDPQSKQRFVEEAQVTAQLDHPSIVPIHDVGIDEDGRLFFSMKLVRGQTLSNILKNAPEPNQEWLDGMVKTLIKVCEAVGFAHNKGVIHRDLKPDNIMIGDFGQVYVMDWGIAHLYRRTRQALMQAEPLSNAGGNGSSDHIQEWVSVSSGDAPIDMPGSIIGTAAYMAPEQAKGDINATDARTDIFALGAVLYKILTNTPPYKSDNHISTLYLASLVDIPWPHVRAPERYAPRALCQIAMKAMSKEPKDRYQNVAEMLQELEKFLRSGGWLPTRMYHAGQNIIQEGDPADEVFIIVSGKCEAYKIQNGVPNILRVMDTGEVFGETALATDKPRTASVRAMTQVVVQVLAREALSREIGEDTWAGALLKTLAARFRDVDARLTSLQNSVLSSPTQNIPNIQNLPQSNTNNTEAFKQHERKSKQQEVLLSAYEYMNFASYEIKPGTKRGAWAGLADLLQRKHQLPPDESADILRDSERFFWDDPHRPSYLEQSVYLVYGGG